VSILVVSSKFKPTMDGLSDYTTKFVSHLKKNNESVVVLTHENAISDEGIPLYKISKRWSFWQLFKNFNKIHKKHDVDRILIQFVPYMYGRAGINFSLPIFVLFIKVFYRDIKVQVMFHELWYPFFYHEPKSWIIHPCHRISVSIIGNVSSRIFCSTENFVKEISYYLPLCKDKITHLPVPSNITVEQNHEIAKEESDKVKIVHFGTLHSSKSSLELFRHFKKAVSHKAQFEFIGVSREECEKYFDLDTYQFLVSRSQFHGKVNSLKVVEIFNTSDLMIAYFIDGATTRRGSLMAAMKYGLPVITNLSFTTDKVLREAPLYFSEDNIENFTEYLNDIIEEKTKNELSRVKLKEYYQSHFSWDRCVESYLLNI
jgi:glycosyltransferase involved in cell wall biosynthesis